MSSLDMAALAAVAAFAAEMRLPIFCISAKMGVDQTLGLPFDSVGYSSAHETAWPVPIRSLGETW